MDIIKCKKFSHWLFYNAKYNVNDNFEKDVSAEKKKKLLPILPF